MKPVEMYETKGGVSIHAPARGATFNPARQYSADKVSIHAPARGATIPPLRTLRN